MMTIPVTVNGVPSSVSPLFNLRFLYPEIVKQLAAGLANKVEPLHNADLIVLENVPNRLQQVRDCAAAYAGYMAQCLTDPEKQQSPLQAIIATGFTKFDPRVQTVVLARVGQLLTASVWLPLREGTPFGQIPTDVKTLQSEVLGHLRQSTSSTSLWSRLRRFFNLRWR